MTYEIGLPEATDIILNIEKRYQGIYKHSRLPEKIRRRVQDNAAQARVLANQIAAYERKIRYARTD